MRRTFRTAGELFHVDTCEPLKGACERGDVKLAAYGRGDYPGKLLPENDLRELCMAGYWHAEKEQTWGLDWHCNEGIEIGWVAAGRLPFAVDERFFEVESGELTITRPWQRHRVGSPHVPASHYSWVILDVGMRRPNQQWHWPKWLLHSKDGLARLTELLRCNDQPVWQGNREIARCFRQIDETCGRDTGDLTVARLKIYINELVVLLAELLENANPLMDVPFSGSERTVRWFLEQLPQRLDEPWTLESMAEACGLGRTHFSAHFRKLANVPPMEFLNRCRVEAAARYLRDQPEISVTEIAFRCGFQSSQYFARVFRRQEGCSPRDYRRNDR